LDHVIINEVLSILSRFNLFYLIVYDLFKVIFLRDVTLEIEVKHMTFLELWLGMTFLELWLGMTDEHEELLSCG